MNEVSQPPAQPKPKLLDPVRHEIRTRHRNVNHVPARPLNTVHVTTMIYTHVFNRGRGRPQRSPADRILAAAAPVLPPRTSCECTAALRAAAAVWQFRFWELRECPPGVVA